MKHTPIIQYRRHIHQNAELSFHEYQTQEYICEILSLNNIPFKKIATTGILAQIGHATQNTIVLRADMDALPITETAPVEFASTNMGVMHACGHDMHSAMLLDAMVRLSQNPPSDKCILGLFQPGEEMHPGGASMVLSENVFDNYSIRAFVGQHCSPEMAVGTIGLCHGEFMASTDEIHLTIKGQGGHAALPHLLRDPVIATAALLVELAKIHPSQDIKHVLAFGRIVANGATNIIPDEVYVEGTFRTFSPDWRVMCKEQIRAAARAIQEQYNISIVVDIRDGYPSVFNNPHIASKAENIILNAFGAEALIPLSQRMTAEDFGFYTRLFPSLFLRLGVGSDTRLHTGDFCPDESGLAVGSDLLVSLATNL